ncbi:collagen-like protein [Streptomyces sp. BE230]|uniref:collagen-like protein n=1 Tax=Streptomyces sp. BE230 TaxID=3002526 RepID=UPI002ED0F912|nr:collagen-like protein [Streptomyces sp. BE230]
MHRSPNVLARRWRQFALAGVLLVLSGAVLLVWRRIDAEAQRTQQVAAEADRRGDAVSTLAGDVRTLRAQIQAKGGTPAAPDPGDAVEDLPDRAAVPVPIPGPPGPRGEQGERGAPATPTPGASGAAGRPGADSTVPGPPGADSTVPGPAGADSTVPGPAGPPGPAGKDGKDGRDGTNGTNGQTCPAGYSLQPPPGDPDGLMCRRDTPTAPDPTGTAAVLGLPVDRRRT